MPFNSALHRNLPPQPPIKKYYSHGARNGWPSSRLISVLLSQTTLQQKDEAMIVITAAAQSAVEPGLGITLTVDQVRGKLVCNSFKNQPWLEYSLILDSELKTKI